MVKKVCALAGVMMLAGLLTAAGCSSTTIEGIRQADVAGITAVVEDGTVNAWKVRVRVTFAVQERLHE